MRLTYLFELAEKYLKLGLTAAGLMAVCVCTGYLIYRKILHGKAGFPLKKLAAAAVILCYLTVVLGATLIERNSVWSGRQVSLLPFLSYSEAWNSFSMQAWRNIILNICMFIPLGFLLPFYGRYWQKAFRTYLTGLAFTLFIELVQLIFSLGIFELDDLFNNLLGTMTGYGFYRLFCLASKKNRPDRKTLLRTALYQLPLILAAVMFLTIFTVYRLQEFGNLQFCYISRADMSSTELTLQTDLSAQTPEVPVYRMSVADESQTHALAQELFERLGTQADDSQTDLYDNTAVYWNSGRMYSVWIDYAGCPLSFTDFNMFTDQEEDGITQQEGCSREEILEALKPFGIEVPQSAQFRDEGNGRYVFEADEPAQDSLCQGTLSCTYFSNGKIYSFENNILTYKKYRDCTVISEQDAFKKLKEGRFRADYFPDGLTSIEVLSVKLQYAADSKGFYQPVYAFTANVSGKKSEILIPALS